MSSDWQIRANADPPQIWLHFGDESEVHLMLDDLRITKAGKTAGAFEKVYFPNIEEPEIPEEVDDLPTPR